ncbi:MAG: hypothetical protein MJZ03_01290 [archaeon]|nr:hypothetical protein [archaeon]
MHCKDVSIHEVKFPLNVENIAKEMNDWTVYGGSEYLVFKNCDSYAVLKIFKKNTAGIFKKVSGYEILSLPENTDFVQDENIDVLNIPTLVLIQLGHKEKGVVIKGMFSHVVFVKDLKPLYLEIIDCIPPSPAKLGVLVKKALDSNFVNLPVVTHETIIDITSKISKIETEAVMFPCKASGIETGIPTYYLDEGTSLAHDVTLIGCNLSRKIFISLYKRDAPFINICPIKYIPKNKKCIVKCCEIKEYCIVENNIIKVPWSADVPEVAESIKTLFSNR